MKALLDKVDVAMAGGVHRFAGRFPDLAGGPVVSRREIAVLGQETSVVDVTVTWSRPGKPFRKSGHVKSPKEMPGAEAPSELERRNRPREETSKKVRHAKLPWTVEQSAAGVRMNPSLSGRCSTERRRWSHGRSRWGGHGWTSETW